MKNTGNMVCIEEFEKNIKEEYLQAGFRVAKSLIIKVLQQLVKREEKSLVNTPDEVAELNKDLPSTIQRQAYNNAIGYTEAKQDTISYLKSEIAKLSTNIDKE